MFRGSFLVVVFLCFVDVVVIGVDCLFLLLRRRRRFVVVGSLLLLALVAVFVMVALLFGLFLHII